jgi:hypothetical protein
MNKFKYLLFTSGFIAMMVILLPVHLQAQDSTESEVTAEQAGVGQGSPCKRSGKGQMKGHMKHQGCGQGKGMGHSMPQLADIDSDGDGFINEDELNSFRAGRMAKMAQEGRQMKHAGNMPSFQDIDQDGDGRIDAAEFDAHHLEHCAKMRAETEQ